MKKLFWVYTVATILAFNSGFAFAGQSKAASPAVKQGLKQLLMQAEMASFEDISDLQNKLQSLQKKLKKEPVDTQTNIQVGQVQSRIDKLVSLLAGFMK